MGDGQARRSRASKKSIAQRIQPAAQADLRVSMFLFIKIIKNKELNFLKRLDSNKDAKEKAS